MKHRLLKLFAITSLLLVFLSSTLASMLPPSFREPVAHAAGNSNYVFYTPADGDSLTSLQDALNNRDESDAAFGRTHVFVKGGVFGDKAFQMNIDTAKTGCAQADHLSGSSCSPGYVINSDSHFGGQDDDLYIYSGQYVCQPGKGYVSSGGSSNPKENYVINYEVGLKMAGEDPLFDGDKIKDTVKLHWLGFGTTNTPGITHWPDSKDGSARRSGSIAMKDLPNNCFPPNVLSDVKESSSDDTELSDKGIVNFFIPVYSQLNKADQKEWNAAFKAGGINPNNSAGAGTDDNALGCDFSLSPLSWVICPVVDLMVKAIGWVDGIITDEMTIPTQEIFCTSGGVSTCDAYYTAWVSFRNIALGLLVVASLIIIIAQAVGMEILDAYTIRKTLPRILVAAVAITLSWPLMNFAVTLSNDLGFGVRNLITAPFDDISNTIHLDLFGDNGFGSLIGNYLGGGVVATAAGAAAVPLWIGAGGLGILLSYLATAGLAVLIAVMVLMLRQIVVIMMILVAPLALVAYILPNTQRIFRFWWEAFTKALLMFPLIAALIATGRVFSAISMQGADAVHGFIAFIAYFAPYFMIPLTFRFAGGIMGGVGNFVNQRGQGMSEGLRNYRSGQRQSRIARARGRGLYREDFGQFTHPWKRDSEGNRTKTSVGTALNTLGLYSLDADEQIPLKLGAPKSDEGFSGLNVPGFRRGAKRDLAMIDEARRQHTQAALQEVDPGYKGGRIMAGLYTGAEHDYIKGLDKNGAAYKELVEDYGYKDADGNLQFRGADGAHQREQVGAILATSSDIEAREAAADLLKASPLLEKYNESHETHRVDPRYLGLMAAAQEGRLGIDDIVANHNAQHAINPARAQFETESLQRIMSPKRTSAARGHGIDFDEHGRAYNVYRDPTSAKAQTSIRREGVQDIAGSKAEDFHGLHGETWVAGLSDMAMHFDEAKGVVEHTEVKGADGKMTYQEKSADSAEYRRAKELQAKVRSIAMYSSGDSGIGLEMKRLWQRAGLDLDELSFGSKAGQPIPRDLIEGMQQAEPPPDAPPPAK